MSTATTLDQMVGNKHYDTYKNCEIRTKTAEHRVHTIQQFLSILCSIYTWNIWLKLHSKLHRMVQLPKMQQLGWLRGTFIQISHCMCMTKNT